MVDRIRACVFCGKLPDNKNREHVLPKWLISLTGDPKRKIKILDFINKREIDLTFDSLHFSSCKACNSKFSTLESENKKIVEKILFNQEVNGREIVKFLDWLDKVRIGLWLGYLHIYKNPFGIRPNFFIEERIALHDRMVCVYRFDDIPNGLSVYGSNTTIFQLQPSCFALRVGSYIFFNVSKEFFCSARLGYKFPKVSEYILKGGKSLKLSIDKFDCYKKIKTPIIRKKIIKPILQIFQPLSHLVFENSNENYGLTKSANFSIYKQLVDRVEKISQMDSIIPYEKITKGDVCYVKDVIAQVFDFQIYLFNSTQINAMGGIERNQIKKISKDAIELNRLFKNITTWQ